MKKKVGILTQPLQNNYGGLLQAYALQKSIRDIGHEVWIINRKGPKVTPLRSLASIGKRFTHKYLLKKNNIDSIILYRPTLEEANFISRHTSYFRENYINPVTPEINDHSGMRKLVNLNFDAYVVGSDQVWRPRYSPKITNYFLDFVEDDKKARKIAYAASFGVANWEFNKTDTKTCSILADKFDAISVRESSGMELCEKYLKANAVHVLDPTLLLNVQDYSEIIEKENEPEIEGNLMTYVLDQSDNKNKFISDVAKELNLIPFSVMQKEQLTQKTKKDISNFIFPPVTKWLRGIRDAEFVVTDSFHGCAFSILFNKPFLAIGNKGRGLARFESILKIFDLEERLITDFENVDMTLLSKKVDWISVNKVLNRERVRSLNFLKRNL